MGLGGIGVSELVIILLVGLLIFGPARLAEVGSSLGRAIRDFRKAMQVARTGNRNMSAQPTGCGKP